MMSVGVGSALEDYAMSWMSSKIGGGGEIVVLTIDHFNVCPWMESWLLHLFKKRAPGKVLAYRLVSSQCQWILR